MTKGTVCLTGTTGARHSILTKEGLIMIPTLQGLAIVAPANMVKNSIPPHVVINGLYFNSKLIDTTAPVFDAGVHQYVFDFSATSYVAPSKVQFKYILEGCLIMSGVNSPQKEK